MAWVDVPGTNSIWEYENAATAANTYADAPGTYSGGIRTYTTPGTGQVNKAYVRTRKKGQQNLLNYSEQFDNAFWSPLRATITSNQQSTTLSENITATQDYIPVASTVGFSTSNVATIGTEDVTFSTITKNYMDYSENLSNANWTKRGLTTVTGSQTDPNGGATAYLVEGIRHGGTYSDLYNYNLINGVTENLAMSFWIKRVTTSGVLYFGNPQNNNLYGNWEVDFSKLGDDWERITKDHIAVTETVNWTTTSNGSAGAHWIPPGGTTQTWDFYFWGVQAESSIWSGNDDVVTGYIGPVLGSAIEGLTNVTRGANSTTAATASSGATLTQKIYDPNDEPQTSEILVQAAGQTSNGLVQVASAISVVDTQSYTVSVFAKKGTNRNYLALKETMSTGGGGVTQWFNLNTGALATLAPGSATSVAAISDEGNGWYRCSVKFTANATRTGGIMFTVAENDGNNTNTDNQGFIYLWGAMFADGSILTPYKKAEASISTLIERGELSKDFYDATHVGF